MELPGETGPQFTELNDCVQALSEKTPRLPVVTKVVLGAARASRSATVASRPKIESATTQPMAKFFFRNTLHSFLS